MTSSTTTTPSAGGTTGAARARRRPLSFERVSFFAVFLGMPLALYIYLVVSPIIQAFYYSLTNWSGYDANPVFVGWANYQALIHDDLFWTALRNNVILAVVLPLITITLALALATLVTVGGSARGQTRGITGGGVYRVVYKLQTPLEDACRIRQYGADEGTSRF